MDVLNAPVTPSTSVSPAKDKIALLEPLRYPPVSELAEPMLRLAGLRINPRTTAQHRQLYFVKVTLKNIADGKEMPVNLAGRREDRFADVERGRQIYRGGKSDADRNGTLDYRNSDRQSDENKKRDGQHDARRF